MAGLGVRANSGGATLTEHPFRFGVSARYTTDPAKWREIARRAEALGYDIFLITDHLGRQLAPVPALMAVADATERLRIGSFVFANDYRNPVMLAKEIATVDVLSGGRVEFGLGAGWATRDYRELGIHYDAPGVRVSRMIEATRLILRLLTDESVDHKGPHYTVHGSRLLPRPVQRPRPPLMIGGGGKRVLSFAAKHAEIVAFVPGFDRRGIPLPGGASERGLARQVEWVRAASGERRPELNVIVFDVGVSDRARSLVAAAATLMKRTANAVVRSPYLLYGSRASLRDLLRERRERFGISYVAIPAGQMEAFAPVVADLAGQ